MSEENGTPTNVSIAPVPTTVDVGVALIRSTDEKMVVLSIGTPVGLQHYFFGYQECGQLIKHVQKSARDCMVHNNRDKPKLYLPGGES